MGKAGQQLPSFRDATRENMFSQPAPQTATAFSQKLTFLMPQTGYLADIALSWTGTITGTGTASGSWPTYPANPWAVMKQVRLYTSDNIEIVNVSGWGLYLANARKRRIMSWGTDVVSYLSTNNRAALLAAPSGSLSGTSNTITGFLTIPVMTDDMLMLGMLLTQTNELRVNLDIVLGSQTDIVGSGAYATTGPFISMTFTPNTRVFQDPGAGARQPNLSYINYLLEEDSPFTLATGDWVYRPATGLIFKALYGVLENASVQIAPANITQVQYKYAQSVVPQQEPITIHTARWKESFGFTPPDGYFDFSFDQGSGLVGMLDTRDLLNSANVTDLQFIFSVTGLTLSGTTQVRAIKEQLGQIAA